MDSLFWEKMDVLFHMKSNMHIKGNKGELSELYAFFKLFYKTKSTG